MKTLKLSTILFVSAFLFSCGSPENSKAQINSDYVAKAQKYYEVKIEEAVARGMEGAPSFIKIIEVDTIVSISSQDAAYIENTALIDEYKSSVEYAKKLVAIDKAAGTSSQVSIDAIDEANSLREKLELIEAEQAKLSKSDTVAFDVSFSSEIHFKDGSKKKGTTHNVVFDKQGDINKELTEF